MHRVLNLFLFFLLADNEPTHFKSKSNAQTTNMIGECLKNLYILLGISNRITRMRIEFPDEISTGLTVRTLYLLIFIFVSSVNIKYIISLSLPCNLLYLQFMCSRSLFLAVSPILSLCRSTRHYQHERFVCVCVCMSDLTPKFLRLHERINVHIQSFVICSKIGVHFMFHSLRVHQLLSIHTTFFFSRSRSMSVFLPIASI